MLCLFIWTLITWDIVLREFRKLCISAPCSLLHMCYTPINLLSYMHVLKTDWQLLYHDINRGFPWVVGLWINFIFSPYVPTFLP